MNHSHLTTGPNEATILAGCNRLIDFHAWQSSKIDPRAWLENFPRDERALASTMLSRFMYFADELVDQMFFSAFQCLSNRLRTHWKPLQAAKEDWRKFCNTSLVTIVQGEDPNPSDSGWLFARKARQLLGIREESLVEPEQAIRALMHGLQGAVIFVDDFVGSGEQFVKTWNRSFQIDGSAVSFREYAASNPSQVFCYCNAMMTHKGRDRLARDAPNVVCTSGNLIPDKFSFTSRTSILWPDGVRDDGREFIREVSNRLGFGEDGGSERDWEGFHKLGLGLAFEHSVPDATLPIFHTDVNGWIPLVRRT